jgi:SagB-type dehydrogenase family enzyme
VEENVTLSSSCTLAFRGGLTLTEQADGKTELCAGKQRIALRRSSPGFLSAIKALALHGATAEELAVLVVQHDGDSGLAKLFYYLERFAQLGLLTYTVSWQARKLATLVPVSAPPARPGVPAAATRYVLSRFAVLRYDSGQFVLESPLGFGRIVLHDGQAAALCHALSTPSALDELARATPAWPNTVVNELIGLMLGIQAVSPADAAGAALAAWSPHDLWFHMRSRQGRHDAPYGATFPLRGVMDPPAIKAPMAGPVTPLFKPDLDALLDGDTPFTRVVETRRSFRHFGARPMGVEALGEWLYRAARIRSVHDRDDRHSYAITSRPYPGAGACHPLELYLAVRACEGLEPGLYHYHAGDHTLALLSGRTPPLELLLERARASMGAPETPQVLVVLAARVQRMMWKYASMAYAAILKDVGVLFQNLYLVATAMGLAPCALGGGDNEVFARATGLDPFIESPVGEFVIGSRP